MNHLTIFCLCIFCCNFLIVFPYQWRCFDAGEIFARRQTSSQNRAVENIILDLNDTLLEMGSDIKCWRLVWIIKITQFWFVCGIWMQFSTPEDVIGTRRMEERKISNFLLSSNIVQRAYLLKTVETLWF